MALFKVPRQYPNERRARKDFGLSWFDESELEILDDKRARRILEMRSGMADGAQRSLSEVGEMLGVGPEWVRQIQNKALFAIRRARLEDRARRMDRSPRRDEQAKSRRGSEIPQ
jgi:DNA-directed RNA polymerase sigma subunit (sigma70/sigma32)